MKPIQSAIALLILPSCLQAASVVTTGQTVGGTIQIASLSVANGDVAKDGDSALTNDVDGNLLFTPSTADANTDWAVTFRNLGLDPNVYTYVQIDFLSVTTGAVSSPWSMFHTDNDSSIGGGNNSSQGLGIVTLAPTPFSVIVDLTDGGTGNTTWGPGTVNNLRFDIFEGDANNKGKTFTMSQVTFGSDLVPEPSIALLSGLAALTLLRRRRH